MWIKACHLLLWPWANYITSYAFLSLSVKWVNRVASQRVERINDHVRNFVHVSVLKKKKKQTPNKESSGSSSPVPIRCPPHTLGRNLSGYTYFLRPVTHLVSFTKNPSLEWLYGHNHHTGQPSILSASSVSLWGNWTTY